MQIQIQFLFEKLFLLVHSLPDIHRFLQPGSQQIIHRTMIIITMKIISAKKT